MKYTAPVAELLALEAVSVVLASAEVEDTPTCPTNTIIEGNCPEDWG